MTFNTECRLWWFRPSGQEWILYLDACGLQFFVGRIELGQRPFTRRPCFHWEAMDDANNGDVDTIEDAVAALQEALAWTQTVPPIEE